VQVVVRSGLAYRWASVRSADSRGADEPCQDYLTAREDDLTLSFALCDGVSQSFFGEMAAEFLGDRLVCWLSEAASPGLEQAALQSGLNERLSEWTREATELVLLRPLPEGIPALQREALESKRPLGSQTAFVCGRIDHPRPSMATGRLVLAWMGDSRIRFWNGPVERTAELGDTLRTDERWSSSRGALGGQPHLMVMPLLTPTQAVTSLMVYTDGLSDLDSLPPPPSNEALMEMIRHTGDKPTSDDATVLEVRLGRAPSWAVQMLAPPAGLKVAAAGHQLWATWDSVPDAEGYDVETGRPLRTWPVTLPEWLSAEMAPGRHLLRVRARRGGQSGRWSNVASAEVAAPPAAPIAQPAVTPPATQPPVTTPPGPAPGSDEVGAPPAPAAPPPAVEPLRAETTYAAGPGPGSTPPGTPVVVRRLTETGTTLPPVGPVPPRPVDTGVPGAQARPPGTADPRGAVRAGPIAPSSRPSPGKAVRPAGKVQAARSGSCRWMGLVVVLLLATAVVTGLVLMLGGGLGSGDQKATQTDVPTATVGLLRPAPTNVRVWLQGRQRTASWDWNDPLGDQEWFVVLLDSGDQRRRCTVRVNQCALMPLPDGEYTLTVFVGRHTEKFDERGYRKYEELSGRTTHSLTVR